MNRGFPQCVTIRWYRKSAALQLWSEGTGAASTHLENGSTATSKYLFPSSSVGNGPAASKLHPAKGAFPLSIHRVTSGVGFGIFSFWQTGHRRRHSAASECSPGHQKFSRIAAISFSLPQWPKLSWVSISSPGRLIKGGTSTHRSGSEEVAGNRTWISSPLAR